jgi:hypothetical protein
MSLVEEFKSFMNRGSVGMISLHFYNRARCFELQRERRTP